jgi:hypothetical protein
MSQRKTEISHVGGGVVNSLPKSDPGTHIAFFDIFGSFFSLFLHSRNKVLGLKP